MKLVKPHMKIQKASEDYLESMLMMKEQHGYIRSVDVADHLGVTKPSVTYATKRLRENGYIEMDRDGLITLTDRGMAIAAKMLDRHHTLTKFLIVIFFPFIVYLIKFFQNFCRITSYDTVIRNILNNYCSCCYYAMPSNFNTRHYLATETEPCFCAYDNCAFTNHFLLRNWCMNILKPMISIRNMNVRSKEDIVFYDNSIITSNAIHFAEMHPITDE